MAWARARRLPASCGSSLRAGWTRSANRRQRPQREVLGEREQRPAGDRRQRDERRDVRVDGAERGAVLDVQREPGRIPAVAARDRLVRAARRRRSGCRRPACRAAARPPTRPPRPRRRRRPSASGCESMIGLKTCNCNGRRPNGYAYVRWITNCCTAVLASTGPTRSFTGWSVRLLQPFFHIYFRHEPDRPRAHSRRGPGDHRLQPPQLPRSVRDRDDGAPADVLRGQEGDLREPLAGLDAERARRVPGGPRRRRRAR